MNKKGIFFTAMALIMVTLILLAFKPSSIEINSGKEKVQLTRVAIANTFVKNLNEGYIIDASKTAAFRALQSLALSVKNNGYVSNLNDSFTELFINGRLNGNPVDFMKNYTLNDSLRKIENISSSFLKIKSNFSIDSVNAGLFQNNDSRAEFVGVKFSLTYYIDAGVVQWNSTKNFQFFVPIQDIYDPYYLKEWSLEKPIHFADYEINYSNNISSLKYFINHTDFLEDSEAPSFLMRLQGNFKGSTCCGMESALYPKGLGFTKEYNMTYIDYCNVSKRCAPDTRNGSLYRIDKITNDNPTDDYYGFRLDARHYVKYRVG